MISTPHPSVARHATGRALAAALIAFGLHRLARYGLATPQGLQPGQLLNWTNDVGAVVAAMTLLRLVTIAVSTYVCAMSLLAAIVSLRPTAGSLSILRGMTPRVMRRALGLGALTALTLPAGIAASRTPPEVPPVLVQIDAPAPTVTATPTRPAPPQPASPAPVPALTAPTAPGAPATWVVRSGDHFWSIASEVVTGRDPQAPAIEVARYWRTLVDANRDRLAVPDDPDLVFAGQELMLPPLDNVG